MPARHAVRPSFVNRAAGLGLVLAAVAPAAAAEIWPYDLASDGADVVYTSPTAVDATSARFAWTNRLDLVEATVQFGFLTFDVDVTDQVPPELLEVGGFAPGPAPVTFFDGSVVYPAPPEPASIAATLTVGIDGDGFGSVTATDISLGAVTVDLGPPFGVQTVNVVGFRLAGELTVDGFRAGDVDGDGDVDFDDLLAVLANFGPCPGCAGDLDFSGDVGFDDILTVIANFD